VPPAIIPVTAAGDTATSTQSFLAYAWSGASATLDGGPVSGNSGLVGSGAGTHTLDVGAQSFTADIVAAPAPNAAFTASPANLPEGGGTTTLTWNLTAGTFLDMALDQRLSPSVATASGSVQVSPTVTTTYRLLMVTEQGGVVKEVTVGVGNTLIFTDGFESGNTAQWSNTVP